MLQYEVLELMLTMVLPRRDVKPLARALLERYGSVTAVLSQPLENLSKFPGLGESSALGLTVFLEAMRYCLQERMAGRDLLNNPDLIASFARMKLGVLRHECYMVILLDGHNQLISWKIISEGEVNMVYHSPRSVAEFALNWQASKIVLVHNHPSGCCMPSEDDIKATADLAAALSTLNVDLADHLVVTSGDHFSFAAHKMLIKPWSEKIDE